MKWWRRKVDLTRKLVKMRKKGLKKRLRMRITHGLKKMTASNISLLESMFTQVPQTQVITGHTLTQREDTSRTMRTILIGQRLRTTHGWSSTIQSWETLTLKSSRMNAMVEMREVKIAHGASVEVTVRVLICSFTREGRRSHWRS